MANSPAERTRTPLRLLSLEDLMDLTAPAHGVGGDDALSLLDQCGDDIEKAVTRIMSEPEHMLLRRYLVRRGLVSVIGGGVGPRSAR